MFNCIQVLVILSAIQGADCLNCYTRSKECPLIEDMQEKCKLGVAIDTCDRCFTCIKSEGEICAGYGDTDGVCGQGLRCNDLAHNTGVCVAIKVEPSSEMPMSEMPMSEMPMSEMPMSADAATWPKSRHP